MRQEPASQAQKDYLVRLLSERGVAGIDGVVAYFRKNGITAAGFDDLTKGDATQLISGLTAGRGAIAKDGHRRW